MADQLITKAHLEEAASCVRSAADVKEGAVALVLGSGMGDVAAAIENPVEIAYDVIPHMVLPTAPMHAGKLVIGMLAGRQVVCMQGRLHAYEGNGSQQIAFPIVLMHELGATELVVTNAAGGINPAFDVGDLMLIDDHVNLLGMNPCVALGGQGIFPPFFDMTNAYSPALRDRARRAADSCGIELRHGVYIATLGPSFETPAEIRAFRTLGADAVGMSTVCEVIAARGCGMDVLGISMISNPAAGVQDEPLSMSDVEIAARKAASQVERLLIAFIEQ